MKGYQHFDVLIVGAGPAGSCAAHAAALAGANALMIEKRRQIGEPVQCAEYIPGLLAQQIQIPRPAIAQKISAMITFMPNGEVIRKWAPGYILNRAKFDQALAMRASMAGAKILTGTKAISKKGDRVKIVGPTGEVQIEAAVIIGADGPDSRVGSWIGLQNRRFVWAVQHTVRLKQPSHDTEFYFGRQYPGGYAWFFPKGKMAHVGVGIRKELGGSVKEALNAFKEKIKRRIGETVAVTSGRIPVGGPLRSIDEDAGIILVGDAAGHTHAITGGGIPQAVICGATAGEAAAASADGNKQALREYSHQWRIRFGSMMGRAAKKREIMEAGWNGGGLEELLHRCWVTGREYYHDA